MADGRLGKCKECTKKDVTENYRNNIGHYVEYERKRAWLPHRILAREKYIRANPEVKAACQKRSRDRYPEKYKANYALTNAVRDKRIKKRPCAVCGSTLKLEGHHEDYSNPLDVVWLCRKHHLERHGKVDRSKERALVDCYREKGVL